MKEGIRQWMKRERRRKEKNERRLQRRRSH
jgi:hypothetical protein